MCGTTVLSKTNVHVYRTHHRRLEFNLIGIGHFYASIRRFM